VARAERRHAGHLMPCFTLAAGMISPKELVIRHIEEHQAAAAVR
jgi:hypothetical protein